LNASNEAAVAAFLNGEIPFTQISATVTEVMQHLYDLPAGSLDEILYADTKARERARHIMQKVSTL
jgi:1-deoxy-D-xylulose-5-phosphate reductoisomerase